MTGGTRKPSHSGDDASTMVAEVTVPASRTRGVLVVTVGAEVGRVISIPTGDMITLGRSEECTASFEDASLSRVHARVVRIAHDYVFSDAGSTNGSFVNDERAQQAVRLRDGDRVQLGSGTTLRFSLVDEAEESALVRAYQSSMRDGLTGVANRKHLEQRLDAEVAFANRQGTALSIIMLDIDYFKRVNDTYGHLGGDEVLRRVGGFLLSTLRTEDLAARYGGEEFVVVLRGIDGPGGYALADRIRVGAAASPIKFDGHGIGITLSAGVASLECCGAQRTKTMLLAVADSRLYQAKQAGRNRVIGA